MIMIEPNKERIKMWIEELESDKWKQGKLHLKNGDKYCCLGVACEVYSRETGIPWTHDRFSVVQKWFGFPCYWGFSLQNSVTAVELNDVFGYSFKMIAKEARKIFGIPKDE